MKTSASSVKRLGWRHGTSGGRSIRKQSLTKGLLSARPSSSQGRVFQTPRMRSRLTRLSKRNHTKPLQKLSRITHTSRYFPAIRWRSWNVCRCRRCNSRHSVPITQRDRQVKLFPRSTNTMHDDPKPHRPLEHLKFPGEDSTYRTARNALLDEEI